ncbi:MAG: hypothetical protein RL134_1228 [Actinomycetota bacterium]|jgi:uncharacterized OsmC-like protein
MTAQTSTNLLNDVDIEAVGGLIQAVSADPTKGATRWRAQVTWLGAFRSEAKVRSFAPIASDEPAALGGTDSAPNPVEQLLAALGNCLAVGYAANATARGIEISELTIDIAGNLDLHTFLGLRPGGHAGFDDISVDVHLESDATAEQIAELHQHVLSTSPVGHTLRAAVPVEAAIALN